MEADNLEANQLEEPSGESPEATPIHIPDEPLVPDPGSRPTAVSTKRAPVAMKRPMPPARAPIISPQPVRPVERPREEDVRPPLPTYEQPVSKLDYEQPHLSKPRAVYDSASDDRRMEEGERPPQPKPSRERVDYLASMVEGQWITMADRRQPRAQAGKGEGKSKRGCEKAHYGDPKTAPWVCDDCKQRRVERHGVPCCRKSTLPSQRRTDKNCCSLLCGVCCCSPCCQNDPIEPIPPYPADFSRAYQSVAYYFRSVE
eukprot:Protomagalhaensia_sp_Gyna_25__2433@NODE_2354_length_1133_cov_117_223949_g1950_i0_p1_GENE_NODE_2354_length_1133_cov_117_223949_g1950_i0NODE_2354_length_1133_cov_117_223949_g1950_i0_p1_ORF_typecomplete_len258_score34_71_NODE_2354_length_1133_cov_117_223949_g1950_i0214987